MYDPTIYARFSISPKEASWLDAKLTELIEHSDIQRDADIANTLRAKLRDNLGRG